MRVAAYPGLDSSPPRYTAFFDDAARTSFYLTRTWFEILSTSSIPTAARRITTSAQSPSCANWP